MTESTGILAALSRGVVAEKPQGGAEEYNVLITLRVMNDCIENPLFAPRLQRLRFSRPTKQEDYAVYKEWQPIPVQNLPIGGTGTGSGARTSSVLQILRIDRVSGVCENPPTLESIQGLSDRTIRPTELGASDWQRSALTVMKIVVALLAAAVVSFASPILAQDAAKPPAKDASPHRVGLVDMAEVFQGYKKFEDMRAELQSEIEKSDAEAKVMVERMQKMQQEMIDTKLAPGSAQYDQGEKALLDAKGEFEAFRAATQRKLARRESEMFKVIYSDTTSMVKKYAEFAKFTVVIRFDRKDINDETAPSEAVQRMNKQVVYYRGEDDITDVVLQTLNKQYEQSSGSRAPVKGVSVPGDAGRAPVR